MRARKLLRASTTDSLCIFCACRLTGDLSISVARPLLSSRLPAQRRGISTTRPPFQSAAAAAADAPITNAANNPSPPPQRTGFDTTSPLSASEQREKAALRSRRDDAEQQQREKRDRTALEQRQRRDDEDARRWKEEQKDIARRADGSRAVARGEVPKRNIGSDRRSPFRKIDGPEASRAEKRETVPRPMKRESETRRSPFGPEQIARQDARTKNLGGTHRVLQLGGTQKHDARKEGADKVQSARSHQAVQRPVARVSLRKSTGPAPKKLAMPDFLTSSATETRREDTVSGWGTTATERAELVLGEDIPPAVYTPPAVTGQDRAVRQSPRARQQPHVGGEFDFSKVAHQREDNQASGFTEVDQASITTRPSPQRTANGRLANGRSPHPPRRSTPPAHPGAQSIADILSTAVRSPSETQQAQPDPSWADASSPPTAESFSFQEDTDSNALDQEASSRRARSSSSTHQSSNTRSNGSSRTFRASPLNARDISPVLTFDDLPQEDWQHFRRREPAPVASQSAQPPPEATRPLYSEDDVDRLFDEHKQQRDQRATQRAPPVQTSYKPLGVPLQTSSRVTKCARCGTEGHHARECPGPKCFKCGKQGHIASLCPSKPTQPVCHSCGEEGHVAKLCPQKLSQPPQIRRTSSVNSFGDQEFFAGKAPARHNKLEEHRQPGESNVSDVRRPRVEARESDDAESFIRDRLRAGEATTVPSEVEEPRVLKSRKFRDEEPEKKKSGRRSRRDEDEDEEYGGRRGRRDFDDQVEDDRGDRKANKREEKEAAKRAERAAERAAQQAEQRNQIRLPEFISVQNLAQAVGARYEQFVSRLEDLGYDDVFPGKILNTEVSGMIAMEYDLEPVFDTGVSEEEERDLKPAPEVAAEDKDYLPSRPPVVTIMGHVDHGKTTILDYLRKSSVAAGEAGGITQHIGAFSVPLAASGKTITFLDTPGHAAFLAMRQRGANVTDIVILVVAADDSVKPQTLEALKHARAANVPIIVAVNKVDKEEADVTRVKQDLARHGVEIEDFGGETQVVLVSGKTGKGMAELEEAVVTLSEILDHRADSEGAVEGWVLEATTKKAGRVATVLVRRGTLKQGTVIVAGRTWTRVRSLRNEAGVAIDAAYPGMPVEVDGWRDQPSAGDEVLEAPSEQKANSVVDYRLELLEREKTAQDTEAINAARKAAQDKREADRIAETAKADPASKTANPDTPSVDSPEVSTGQILVPFILKADVSGSAEALSAYLQSLISPLIRPDILSSTVGPVHESDIEMAETAGGHIIAFNLPPNPSMLSQAEAKGIKVLENNVIYRVLDDVKAVLEDRLPPIITQRVMGEAEVVLGFDISLGGKKSVKIAGVKVRNGVVTRNSRVRVMRGSEKIFDGTISSLKNVKRDVQEMRKGTECGIGFALPNSTEWQAFEPADLVQCYEERSERRKL
ncbi:translation initiation factor IF-2 [Oleoguttula sp. CCFEE 5521]